MTENEAKVLAFAVNFRAEKGFSPSEVQFSEGTGLARNTIRNALKKLETYGYVRKLPKAWRGVEILRAA